MIDSTRDPGLYMRLVNACISHQERAELALIFAMAAIGIAAVPDADIPHKRAPIAMLESMREAMDEIQRRSGLPPGPIQ